VRTLRISSLKGWTEAPAIGIGAAVSRPVGKTTARYSRDRNGSMPVRRIPGERADSITRGQSLCASDVRDEGYCGGGGGGASFYKPFDDPRVLRKKSCRLFETIGDLQEPAAHDGPWRGGKNYSLFVEETGAQGGTTRYARSNNFVKKVT